MVNTLRLTGPCPPPGQGEMSTGETHIMVNFARILGVELHKISVFFEIIPTIPSFTYSLIIKIILFFLLHVTLVSIVINLTSGFNKYLKDIYNAAISKQFIFNKVF